MATVIAVTLDNIDAILDSQVSLYTTFNGFWGPPYERQVLIKTSVKDGEVYYRFADSWEEWHPVQLKKHSQYIYINGQVLYIH